MVNSTVLDIAISLIFVYITLSLICMTITEIITRKRDSRQKVFDETFKAIFENLTGEESQKALEAFKRKIHTILGAGGIASEKQPNSYKQIKSYSKLTPKTISVAMYETLRENGFLADDGTFKKPLKIGKLSGKINSESLLSVLIGVEKNIGKELSKPLQSIKDRTFEKIEQWTNSVLDKIQETYKKKAEFFALIVAIIVVVVNNADTLSMSHALKNDLVMQEILVSASDELLRTGEESNKSGTIPPSADATPSDSQSANERPATTNIEPSNEDQPGDNPAPAESSGKSSGEEATQDNASSDSEQEDTQSTTNADNPSEEIKKYVSKIRESGLPFGPDSWGQNLPKLDKKTDFDNALVLIFWLIKKIIGLSATIALVSLGAPFWLETLKKIVDMKKKVK